MAASAWQDAARHRRGLAGVTWVAITGSCGKSTATHLAHAIISRSLPGTASAGSANCGGPLARRVCGVAPGDLYALQELGAWGPGTLDAGIELVQPDVGVVLNVRRDHWGAFRGLERTAAEKAKVVAALPPEGTAILNADDPRVRAMAGRTRARVLWFGRSRDAELRATRVTASWPERLRFELHRGSEVHEVRTRLVGEQALGSVLAALGVALALEVPLGAAVARLAGVEPLARRMSTVQAPGGITFVRDDFKAPSDSLGEAVAFLAAARAERKVAVIGRISDHPGRSRRPYTQAARAAMAVVDELVFAGERPWSLWSGEATPWTVHPTVEAAARALGGNGLHAGDLVLLKGSGPADHLERILLARTGAVRCWLEACGRVIACDECELLRSGPPQAASAPSGGSRSAVP